VHQNGTFAARKNFLGTYHPLSGDRIYRNDSGHFSDVTKESGIHSSAISYGLGITVSDIDLDGAPDLYVGNDFHENDYLYINQRNGTFRDELTERVMHTSQFSMGVDVADINNDALPEIISMDMLPADPYILKRSLGEDEFNIFNMKIGYGYNHQYTRNNLQWNRGNGLFSEVGLYSGIAATDWSWAPLWTDFDNDGLKDLFISNGIPRRLNDIDYVNFISNSELQEKISRKEIGEKDMKLIDQFPQIKLRNKFFLNRSGLAFGDMEESIENDKETYSNGALYADLDNDGDQDIVVNNIDAPALVYQNRSNDSKGRSFASLKLKGPAKNVNALGSKLVVYAGNSTRTYEKYPVRGFQSSMETPLHLGLHGTQIDSAVLIWPDNSFEKISLQKDSIQSISYKPGLPQFNYTRLAKQQPTADAIEDITKASGLQYRHEENAFVEFDREPLIPFMVSKEGPAAAVGDLNGDGLDDIFLGAGRGKKAGIFHQKAGGRFEHVASPGTDMDSSYEAVDALIIDVNGDGAKDLIIASGGNEYYGKDEHLLPLLYVNDGTGGLRKDLQAFPREFLTASCIVPADFNSDGAIDLFVGARTVPWEYGQAPSSLLLQNDGKGRFRNVTASIAPGLSNAGMVKSAVWSDLDKDKDDDLLLALEWGEVVAFINNRGGFTKRSLTKERGWWNFILPFDADGDGDMDLLAGNQGLNNRVRPSDAEPVRLYHNDFDGNGKKEQVLTYYIGGKETPFANKDELQRQIPEIKKRFLYAGDFAKAGLDKIFTKDRLRAATVWTADYFHSAVLINDGKLNFTLQPLPWQAQLTPYKTAVLANVNGDNLPDVYMFGNFFENNIQMGRYDADYGMVLLNAGGGKFRCETMPGLAVKGQVRQAKPITVGGKSALLLARNNDSALLIRPAGGFKFY
jgi:hypothetical protein